MLGLVGPKTPQLTYRVIFMPGGSAPRTIVAILVGYRRKPLIKSNQANENGVPVSSNFNSFFQIQMGITLEHAQAAIQAAHHKALEMGVKMNIAVVDAGANLVAFARMDGAWLGSLDIAIKKAKTARFFDMPTGDLGKASQPGGSLYNIEHSNGGLITFPGGLPITDASGQIIGAIGVSGDAVENDHEVAAAGVQAVAGK